MPKPENPPAPRDERAEARRLQADFEGEPLTFSLHKNIRAFVSLIDSVCERRDEARQGEWRQMQEKANLTVERDSLKEQLDEANRDKVSAIGSYGLALQEAKALKEQLAGAHAISCDCHGPSCCEGYHERIVDPRCAELRK